jgi:hypothetical protein
MDDWECWWYAVRCVSSVEPDPFLEGNELKEGRRAWVLRLVVLPEVPVELVLGLTGRTAAIPIIVHS